MFDPKPPRRGKRNAVQRKPRGGADTAAVGVHSTRVRIVADALRKEILRRLDGDRFLGSEAQLLRQLNTSIPTLRQAVRLMQHEHLLVTRPGVGGGFFATAPSTGAVAQMASTYLQAHGATIYLLAEASSSLVLLAAQRLTQNQEREVRAELKRYLDDHQQAEHWRDDETATRTAAGYYDLIGRLSGNPAVHLMIQTLVKVAGEHVQGSFQLAPSNVETWKSTMYLAAQAIEEGDLELATLFMQRHATQVLKWMSK